ncbi:MAG: hypothetical protein MR717_04435 [Prevotella sp.]|nr:hypothetical protein [Prevotella sp.]
MDTRKQQLRKVCPEDFDADALLRAAREGRLFIAPAAERQPLTEVLDYVERIREYATNPHVREIWEAILSHERLAPLFYLTRYSSQRGQINWYRVTAVVCLLQENGVYRKDIAAVQLHLCLERVSKRNKRYTGKDRYLLERPELLIVRQIVKDFSL